VNVRGRDAMLAPLEAALREVKADEAELWVHRRRSAISRYAKNEIHQNAVADETHVQARVVIGKAMGIASANSLDPADLRRLVADATAAARESAPNAQWPGLAAPAEI
jgi:predicted Zn-dependent protease